jgi:hypothetical protein
MTLPTSRLDAEYALYALGLSGSQLIERELSRDVYPIDGLRIYWIARRFRVDTSKALKLWL